MAKLTQNLKLFEEDDFLVAKYKEVKNLKEAFKAADFIGYPVVLKINSDIHKSKVGGVVSHIHNALDLKNAWEKLDKLRIRYGFEDFILQKQIDGIELILGAKTDPIFGKVLMIGSGGIFTEVLHDVSFRVLPIIESDVKAMLRELKISKLLKNEKRVINTAMKFSKLAQSINFKEIDVNPVIINNSGAWIVDARIMV